MRTHTHTQTHTHTHKRTHTHTHTHKRTHTHTHTQTDRLLYASRALPTETKLLVLHLKLLLCKIKNEAATRVNKEICIHHYNFVKLHPSVCYSPTPRVHSRAWRCVGRYRSSECLQLWWYCRRCDARRSRTLSKQVITR